MASQLGDRILCMNRLDHHFKIVTRAAYERYGRAYGEMLARWPAIAGDRLAAQTRPERIVWPRSEPKERKSDGVLVVRVEPAFALDLQYEAPVLIERINGYFGYGAIGRLRIVKGPTGNKPRKAPRPPVAVDPEAIGKQLAGIDDDRLKAALSKLGSGLKSVGRMASKG